MKQSKCLRSISSDGMCIRTDCIHNSNTDKITITNCFSKSHGYNGGLKTNRNCNHWLGNITEIILMNMFDHVDRMPFGNPGFDFICGNGYKIDAKGACFKKNTTRWTFGIDRNKTADYFLCLAFDNREDLNPLHVWLIPGNILNHLTATGISESTLDRWSEYEQPLDKVLMCCHTIKNKVN